MRVFLNPVRCFFKKSGIVLLFLTLLFPAYVLSQSHVILKGEIRNAHDSTVLPFVHVQVEGVSVGTLSNESGQFELHLADSLSDKKVIFSCIGFKSFEQEVASAKDSTFYYLEPDIQLLEAVTIDGQVQDSALAIMEKVFQKMKKNYPRKRHFLECFYREVSLRNHQYTHLLEAAVEVQDYSYRRSTARTRVKVLEVRKSEDFRHYSVKSRFIKKAVDTFAALLTDYEKKESVYEVLNMANRMQQSGLRIDKSYLDKYLFYLQGIVPHGKRSVYKVFYHSPLSETFYYREGYLYIDTEDYAIVKAESYIKRHPEKESWYSHLTDEQGIHRYQIAQYKKQGDTYYPHFLKTYDRSDEGTDASKGRHFEVKTLTVNQVYDKRKTYDKIRRKEAIEKEKNLYEEDFAYNAEFWKHYNILLMDPSYEKMKSDLEAEKTLQEQFNNQ